MAALDLTAREPADDPRPEARGFRVGVVERHDPPGAVKREDPLCRVRSDTRPAMATHHEELSHLALSRRKLACHDEAGQRALVANEMDVAIGLHEVVVDVSVRELTVLIDLDAAHRRHVVAVELHEIRKHCLVPFFDPDELDWHVLSLTAGAHELTISNQANILLVLPEGVKSVRVRPTLSEFEVVFDALAHETRRHIVQLLAHYGPELPSGYLAKRFAHSWPTTTRHLHVLEDAGIVSVRRDGRSCIYRLELDRLERVVGGWLAYLEPSRSRQTWRSPRPRSVRKEALL